MSAEEFLKSLFGTLPALFKDESALREIWSKPDTRKTLLESLAEQGFSRDQLSEMQRLIDAERSDLYDVLAYVAFATPTVTRAARSHRASMVIEKSYDKDHRLFLEFVLAQYVIQGVDELDYSKLAPLLTVKFGGLHDASKVLGDMIQIRTLFTDFQPYLYDYVQ